MCKAKDSRGTLSQYLLQMSAEADPSMPFSAFVSLSHRSLFFIIAGISFSRFRSNVSLRNLGPGIYRAVYTYLRNLWAPQVNLIAGVPAAGSAPNTVSFSGNAVSYANIRRGKQLYSSANAHHGRSAQFAYVNGRIPVKIDYILQAKQSFDETTLVASFAVVRCFQSGHDMPDFPWAIRSVGFSQ